MTKELKRFTSDCIPCVIEDGKTFIYLIKRKNKPFGYAIAGGFRDPIKGHEHLMEEKINIPKALENDDLLEDPLNAAKRELKEELNLNIKDLIQIGYYDSKTRDPRGHTASHAYYGYATGNPEAKSDAESLIKINISNLHDFIKDNDIAFDHKEILKDFLDLIKQ